MPEFRCRRTHRGVRAEIRGYMAGRQATSRYKEGSRMVVVMRGVTISVVRFV